MKKRQRKGRGSAANPKPTPGGALGIAWYSPEDFALMKNQGVDVAIGCDTYQEWLSEYRRVSRTLRERGLAPIEVQVRVAELAAWLRERGLPNTTENRVQYVTWRLQHGAQR